MVVRCKWCRIPLFWFGGRQAKGSSVAPFGNWGWFSSSVIFKIRPFFDAFQLPPSGGVAGRDSAKRGSRPVGVETPLQGLKTPSTVAGPRLPPRVLIGFSYK